MLMLKPAFTPFVRITPTGCAVKAATAVVGGLPKYLN
jgi:hypothetical protein